MSLQNQPKKRKSKPFKKEVEPGEPKQAKRVPFQEIAFINRTDPPPPAPLTEQSLLSDELFSRIPVSLIQQFLLFVESHFTYYTKDTFMKTFGISSKTTLNKWIKEKGLPYYQVDSIIIFKKSDVDEFLNKFRKMMPVAVATLLNIFNGMDVDCLLSQA